METTILNDFVFQDSSVFIPPITESSTLNRLADNSLIIIDGAVSISEQQLSDLSETGAEIIQLDADLDGIHQITNILASRRNIDSLHIFSHGSQGRLQLGNEELSLETLDNYRDSLLSWDGALTKKADILLYACELGEGVKGSLLSQELRTLTGADIAASNDLTGSAELNGDWDLEIQTGEIETATLIIDKFEDILGDVDDNQQVLRLNFDDISELTAIDTSPSNIQNNGVLRSGTSSQYIEDPDNFQGGIVELSGNNSGINVANYPEINTATHAKRSVVVNFKVDEINTGRRVIYEEGGGARGLNIYIDSGQLYIGGWNRTRTGGNWSGTYLSTGNINSGEWNQVILTLNAISGQRVPQNNAFKGYLNGTEFSQGVGSELLKHANGIGIGNIKGQTRFHDGVSSGDFSLDGSIGDVQIFNRVLDDNEVLTLAEGFDGNPTPPPDAVDDSFTIDEDTPLNDNVSINDTNFSSVTEVNGVTADVGLQITLSSGALLTLNSDGSFDYDPNGQFEFLNDGETASDSFSYSIINDTGTTDTATVNITIDGVTDDLPPDAVDDSFTIDEDTPLNDNVSINDTNFSSVTEVNGAAADVGLQITLSSGALLTLNSDGSFDYDPNGQFEFLNDGETANDSFSYTIDDGSGDTDTATVNITIDGVTDDPAPILLNSNNPGFEKDDQDWNFVKTGRSNIYGEISVVQNGESFSGEKQLFLKLPQEAASNYDDQISINQTFSLSTQKRYAVEAQVKWLNPNNSLPSAIISLWSRNPDQETFFGKDFEIFADANGQTEYEQLRFEFTPNEDGDVLVWLGLFTHRDGLDDTEIYVDDFKITEIGDAVVGSDPRTGNLIENGDFSENTDWQITRNNPNNVPGLRQSIESGKLRLKLPGTNIPNYLNNTWAGLYQTERLYEGVTYELSADFDRITQANNQTRSIVNVFAYRPKTFSETGELLLDEEWIGPIDYDFECNEPGNTCRNENHRKTFRITPNQTADYRITFQVLGWGNNGVPITVDIDNVDLRVI